MGGECEIPIPDGTTAIPTAHRCWTRARTAAVSQTSRSSVAGMTASEILNPP